MNAAQNYLITVEPTSGIDGRDSTVIATFGGRIGDVKLAGFRVITGQPNATIDDMHRFEDKGGYIDWRRV